jgi:DNA polymerase-3 subunit epsilon
VVDTVALFRRAQGQSAVDDEAIVPLSDAARDLGLPVHRPHHADGDALTTAQLFLAVATRLDAREPQTVGSLARR